MTNDQMDEILRKINQFYLARNLDAATRIPNKILRHVILMLMFRAVFRV